MDNIYLGIDVGSVSINIVAINDKSRLIEKIYLRTEGKPIENLQYGLNIIKNNIYNGKSAIRGVGTTGSGRNLASLVVGADVVKNEITAHSIASITEKPEANTVIEIGGQDSKLIIIRNKIPIDFSMNTICAAGTGSFIDRQAERLNVDLENFGKLALKSKKAVRIAGRCAVFAESDMIHKQQLGYSLEDIIWGLCKALARNYLNNLGKGKEIKKTILFQGGVAANIGIKKAFEELTGEEIHVPKNYDVMGALGASILAKEKIDNNNINTKFKGFETCNAEYKTKNIECSDCTNNCEIIEISLGKVAIAMWGDKCGKWNSSLVNKAI